MSTLTLHESLAVLVYKSALSFSQYKTLAEWLGVYTYILPKDQVLRESALSVSIRENTSKSALHFYHWLLLLETCYTDTEQSNIIRNILCYPQHLNL